MSCSAKLYINRAFDIPLQIAEDSDLTVSDISAGDLSVTLTLKGSDPVESATYIKSSGGVDITGSVITILVLEGDITTAGYYKVAIDFTDAGGKKRGVTPCPAVLEFHQQ